MIDNEATQILGGGMQNNQSQQAQNAQQAASQQSAPVNNTKPEERSKKPTKKDDNMTKVGYAAGGFAAGVAASAATSAMAASRGDEEAPLQVEPEPAPATNATTTTTSTTTTTTTTEVKPEPESEHVRVETIEVPDEQDVIVATDEGIRVAQVDDDLSFSQAFAEARAQVGPGGVFEWHGKVYHTYTSNEWDKMSAQERADFQQKVDYNDVTDGQHNNYTTSEHHSSVHDDPNVHQTAYQQEDPTQSSGQYVQPTGGEEQPAGGDIHVLGVEVVDDGNGGQMTIAGIGNDAGDSILLIDPDNDGHFDLGWHDDNGDGQVQESEVFDASDCPYTADDLAQAAAMENGMTYAYNDNLPDYSNDADVSTFA